MTDTLELSRQLNACIKDSDVYKNYQYCKDKLRQKPEKLQQLMEFRKKNYEIHLLLESKADYENKYLKKYFENEDLYEKRIFVSIGNLTDSTVISKIIENI